MVVSAATPSEILFGKLARKLGYVTEEQLRECVAAQQGDRTPPSLGRLFMERGYLTPVQADEIARRQRTVLDARDPYWNEKLEDRLFGSIAVKKGFCSNSDVHRAVRGQAGAWEQGERRRLGDLLVEQGSISETQRSAVIDLQQMQLVDCPGCDRKYPRKLLARDDGVTCLACGTRLWLADGAVQSEAGAAPAGGALRDGSVITVETAARPLSPAQQQALAQHDTDDFRIPDEGLPDRGLFAAEPMSTVTAAGRSRAGRGAGVSPAAHGRDARATAPPGRDGPGAAASDSAATAPLPYERLGPFALERCLGRGAMGVVYLARDTAVERPVALKVLPPELAADRKMRERFRREGVAASRLDHPNIVRVFGAGETDGVPYLAMEYIDGATIKALLAGKRFSPRETAETMAECARALDYAHRQGIVHRDVKPENVILRARDGRPLLMDFGLAREGGAASLTKSGQIVGTPTYMAPEMIEGKGAKVDGRADLYGLAATGYEMVTGKRVVDGPDLRTILSRVLFQDPKPPRALRETIPADLETILLKTLEKDPAHRYETGARLAEDLEAFLADEPISARPPTLWEKARKYARRHRQAAAAAGVAAVASLLGLVFLVNWVLASSETEQATRRAETAEAEKEEVRRAQLEQEAARLAAEQARLDRRARAETVLRPFRAVVYASRYQPDIEFCRDRFSEAIGIDRTFAEAYQLRGLAHERTARAKEALEDYEEAVRLDPSNDQARYLAGRLSFTAFDTDVAAARVRATFASFRDRSSQSAYALLSRAYLAFLEQRYKDVLLYCNQAKEANPTFADVYYVRASMRSYFIFGEAGMAVYRSPQELADKIAALEDLNRCLNLDPTNMEAYLLRGILREQGEEWEPALADLDAAVSLNPNSPRARFWRARQYAKLGRVADAAHDYEQAIALSDGHRTAIAARGIFRFGQHDFVGADADFSHVIATQEPGSSMIFFCRAVNRACLDRVDEGRADWRAWLNYHPEIATGITAIEATEGDPRFRGRLPDVMLDQSRIFELPPERQMVMRAFQEQAAYSPELQATLEGFGRFGEITFQHLEFMKLVNDLANENGPEKERMEAMLAAEGAAPSFLDLTGVIHEYLSRADIEDSLIKREQLQTAAQYYQRGAAFYRRREHERALADLRQAVALKPFWAEAHYGLALVAAWEGYIVEAMDELEAAGRMGWKRWDYTQRDVAFTHLRENPRFQALVGR